MPPLIIARQWLDDYAEKAFRELCGIDRRPKRLASLWEKALRLRDEATGDWQCRFTWRSFRQFSLQGDTLEIEGIRFVSGDLAGYGEQQIDEILVYLFRGPAWQAEEGLPTIELLLKNNWASAYVMAAFKYLRQYFSRRLFPDQALSPSLAPGYGFSCRQVEAFFQLVNGGAIGIELTEEGLIRPFNSCVGLYLVYRRPRLELPFGENPAGKVSQ
ncbi:MAG: hypothetical protein K6B40_01805 [Firmicutes bacterium]|nr:hypothetical protein [Bacillota bacterium]